MNIWLEFTQQAFSKGFQRSRHCSRHWGDQEGMSLPKLPSTTGPRSQVKLPTLAVVIVNSATIFAALSDWNYSSHNIFWRVNACSSSTTADWTRDDSRALRPQIVQGPTIALAWKVELDLLSFWLSGIGIGKGWIRWLVVKMKLEGDKRETTR